MWCHLACGLTWAHGGAGSLLEGLALAEGASVEGGRVGAGPRALLPAAATAVRARRPLCPAGPATVHCEGSRCHPAGLALHPEGPPGPIPHPEEAPLLRTGPPKLDLFCHQGWGLRYRQADLGCIQRQRGPNNSLPFCTMASRGPERAGTQGLPVRNGVGIYNWNQVQGSIYNTHLSHGSALPPKGTARNC